jgi:DNA-binding NarL/FixJ family response regulator
VSIRVVVVDDQALVRGGFAMVLRIHDDIEVVAEAGTGLRRSRWHAGTAPT